ncbi:hypothetical protein [Winogradskyella marincola]|uniref:Uncharacterized protein n=1 Tax=Winogradskyella marincola TaxID=3037795 RepID=A0ABT6G2G8_9FLAO|nr:hypothetical protein [Winogradskyella sp. YYF002]MDG4716245.1 hypothetical protein [Winogradskyella sp. YYF002]
MIIDKDKVQTLINSTIGSEYEIHNTSDSSKYIFITWKHKDYEWDDERGSRIGVGPIAYNKATHEYKLLGSGDMLSEEYYKYLFENIDLNSNNEIPDNNKIKSNILRRNYVNEEDIFYLTENYKKDFGDFKYSLSYPKNLNVDYVNQVFIDLCTNSAVDYFIKFWNEIDFEYSKVSETELLLNRIKKTNAQQRL